MFNKIINKLKEVTCYKLRLMNEKEKTRIINKALEYLIVLTANVQSANGLLRLSMKTKFIDGEEVIVIDKTSVEFVRRWLYQSEEVGDKLVNEIFSMRDL